MQIPNALITIRCHNGITRGPLIYPAYAAPVLRRVYSGMLDVTAFDQGIEVAPFPENGDEAMRYREVFLVDQEIGWMRRLYGPKNAAPYVDSVWTEETLKKEMGRLLMQEHERLTKAAKPKVVVAANPTFLAFGLTEEQARNMQLAGFVDRAACVGQDIVDLANVPKITIELAGRLATADAKVEAKK